MTDTAIRVENLSKRYRVGPRERYKALRDVLTDAFVAPFRRLREMRNPKCLSGCLLPSAVCLLVFRNSPSAIRNISPAAFCLLRL